MKLKNGYLQVYTGNGKGKTTAALGVALRAAGAGLKVYICQFMKKGPYSEIRALKKLGRQIKIEQFGTGCFVRNTPQEKDIKAAAKGLSRAQEILLSKGFDVVILDEACLAVHLKLIPLDKIIKLILDKPSNVELILTGRNAPDKVLKYADLVTEMIAKKHYYTKGIKARTGIEE